MRVRLIVPRRGDGGERDALWQFCADYWRRSRPDWEIREGYHDDGPFNRSAAINAAAAARGRWDVAVILDGDTILDIGSIEEGCALAMRTGNLVLPFTRRRMLTQAGTRRILGGYRGSWARWIAATEGLKHISSCVIVPRSLFTEVGGFDERFEGWGGEDDAFHAACRTLAGVERLDGDAWHLWHPVSPWRDHESSTYRRALALSQRYVETADPDDMRRLLAEPRGSDQVVVVALTTGRRPTLAKAIASADEHLRGPIGRRLLCVDSAPTETLLSLARRYPHWDIAPMNGRSGYGAAVTGAIRRAIGSGQDWIFWLEDDFTFEEPVELTQMQALMDRHRELVQLSLLRQAWYEDELAAGGIVEAKPDAFSQCDGYIEHRDYWTQNPMLCRRELLASHVWPAVRSSERRFADIVFKDPAARGGILGKIGDPPRCRHIGLERAGFGY